ncbi:Ribosomal large subunit pseudouridine synthase B [Kingella potus]|uniref:Pseudouridine synthase n=1 Tax=Kingella potus TaxID=265175 RepID=A0A377R6V9_9NEIS|nr:pseudouridine synthase [Kingella potus]UOP00016.1 pseudouridine synthase [Kingella potus]STR03305.1 Ribosomal large subunit pseudouridine synthase B [Kingella potus]
MPKKKTSKRQWRDGVSATPAKTARAAKRPSENRPAARRAVETDRREFPRGENEQKAFGRGERRRHSDGTQQPESDGRRPTARNQAAARSGTGGRASEKRLPESRKPSENLSGSRPPKQRASKAKKLVVRNPNRKIMERARELKERRGDLARIEPERLQKVLAASGVGSRREMEEWIAAGLVQVNGRPAQLGDKVSPDDQVTVKGSIIRLKWADRLPRIILYYKQEGEIVSRDDPQGRVSIFDRLPQAASSRWVAVGRLDINTCGLLILTTSGELVQRFAHPSFEVEREYAVRVLGEMTTEQMRQLTEEGVMLEDGIAKVERIFEQGGEGANKWYSVVIKEGRNREVRRIFEHFGLTVSRLVRTGFGPIGLPNRLKRGRFYELNPAEVANIVKWADMGLPGEKRRRK